MEFKFKSAERKNLNIRLALCGPTGSGKTFTALGIALTLADGGKVAVIDTERSSADRYADKFAFDSLCLESFSPENYITAIEAAAAEKYPVLVIDSLSHAWDGQDGLLEKVEMISARSKSGNPFNAWGQATPIQRRMVDAILSYPGHIIITMRSKMEYVQERNESTGKTTIKKVGLAPVQRQGIEYEFDLVGELDTEHVLVMTKSRAADLADRIFPKPGKKFAEEVLTWAKGGKKPAEKENAPQMPQEAPKNPQPTQTPPEEKKAPPAPSNGNTGKQVAQQLRQIREGAIKLGAKTPEEIRSFVSGLVNRDIKSATDLTEAERAEALSAIEYDLAQIGEAA